MKATAIMKTGLASSPAYSDAVFEIDITVSIRGQKAAVIVAVGTDTMRYDSTEGIGPELTEEQKLKNLIKGLKLMSDEE